MIVFTEPLDASPQQRARAVAFIGVTLLGLLYVWYFNPVGSGLFLPCLFNKATGFYCPGCGTTRALHYLLHGQLTAAFAMNPLTMLALPFVAYAFASYALFGLRGRSLPKVFVYPTLIKLLFITIVAFWVLRNIPCYPFTLLAPHTI
jgi:hypothetical protein